MSSPVNSFPSFSEATKYFAAGSALQLLSQSLTGTFYSGTTWPGLVILTAEKLYKYCPRFLWMLQKSKVTVRNKCSLSMVLQALSTLTSHGHKLQPWVALLGFSTTITTSIRNPFRNKKIALVKVREQTWSLTWEHEQLILLPLLTPEEILKCIHWWMTAIFHFRIIPFREKEWVY